MTPFLSTSVLVLGVWVDICVFYLVMPFEYVGSLHPTPLCDRLLPHSLAKHTTSAPRSIFAWGSTIPANPTKWCYPNWKLPPVYFFFLLLILTFHFEIMPHLLLSGPDLKLSSIHSTLSDELCPFTNRQRLHGIASAPMLPLCIPTGRSKSSTCRQ